MTRWTFADEIERKQLRAERMELWRRRVQVGMDQRAKARHALDPNDTHPLSVEQKEQQA